MNIPDFYDYLTRARRDLWTFLETLPDEALSRAVILGPRFHCIKDLLFHIADVEDGWSHWVIMHDSPVQASFPGLENAQDSPHKADMSLELLLSYWRAVEKSTLECLNKLTPEELARAVIDDSRGEPEPFAVEGILWHVMQHEVRHTAQIVLLSRQMGFKPPSLDLLFYLPSRLQ